jgi:hypothetical protein
MRLGNDHPWGQLDDLSAVLRVVFLPPAANIVGVPGRSPAATGARALAEVPFSMKIERVHRCLAALSRHRAAG